MQTDTQLTHLIDENRRMNDELNRWNVRAKKAEAMLCMRGAAAAGKVRVITSDARERRG